MKQDDKICVGMIAAAHGVRGLVRLRSFMENPAAIVDFEPITDEKGERTFAIQLKATAKDFFIATIEGVESRELAEALRGTKLYVSRHQFPKTGKREYYEADLIGLSVQDKQAQNHGFILAVHNYGAGIFLEIGVKKNAGFMLPFTEAYVPLVDLKAECVTIDPPKGWLESETKSLSRKRDVDQAPRKGNRDA